MLPLAPAVGIIIARRLASKDYNPLLKDGRLIIYPLIISAAVSLSAVWSDYTLAGTARKAAVGITSKYSDSNWHLWFQGHWGFQYYAQGIGGKPFDIRKLGIGQGDIVVVPATNTNVNILPGGILDHLETVEFSPCRWLATMNPALGAGFYSDFWGPLPLAFGPVPLEKNLVLRANTRVSQDSVVFREQR